MAEHQAAAAGSRAVVVHQAGAGVSPAVAVHRSADEGVDEVDSEGEVGDSRWCPSGLAKRQISSVLSIASFAHVSLARLQAIQRYLVTVVCIISTFPM